MNNILNTYYNYNLQESLTPLMETQTNQLDNKTADDLRKSSDLFDLFEPSKMYDFLEKIYIGLKNKKGQDASREKGVLHYNITSQKDALKSSFEINQKKDIFKQFCGYNKDLPLSICIAGSIQWNDYDSGRDKFKDLHVLFYPLARRPYGSRTSAGDYSLENDFKFRVKKGEQFYLQDSYVGIKLYSKMTLKEKQLIIRHLIQNYSEYIF